MKNLLGWTVFMCVVASILIFAAWKDKHPKIQVSIPTQTKTEWNGARRYVIETYKDPKFGVQKRVVGVEQPQVEGMMDPVSLAAELDNGFKTAIYLK